MARKVEDEVMQLEKRYWTALKANDMDTALSLTDDPCIVTGAQGVNTIDRATFEKMMKASPWTLEDFELADFHVRRVSDDVAIVAYKVKESVTVDGKPLKFEAADASTWIRKNGKWVCAQHSEAITGDPFGRDRRPAA